MLSPYLDSSTDPSDVASSKSYHTMPIDNDNDIQIRHLPPEPGLAEDIVNSVIEMYIKEKLASRPRGTRNTEKGRHEVGQKLAILEKEVSGSRIDLDVTCPRWRLS
jgi:hypothetical protein